LENEIFIEWLFRVLIVELFKFIRKNQYPSFARRGQGRQDKLK